MNTTDISQTDANELLIMDPGPGLCSPVFGYERGGQFGPQLDSLRRLSRTDATNFSKASFPDRPVNQRIDDWVLKTLDLSAQVPTHIMIVWRDSDDAWQELHTELAKEYPHHAVYAAEAQAA